MEPGVHRQGERCPELIASVLAGGGFGPADYRLELNETYPVEEHICQYRESDLAFLSRWMEREGLYYYADASPDADVLVISDHRSFQRQARAALPYAPHAFGDATLGAGLETMFSFRSHHAALASEVTLRRLRLHAAGASEIAGSAPVSPFAPRRDPRVERLFLLWLERGGAAGAPSPRRSSSRAKSVHRGSTSARGVRAGIPDRACVGHPLDACNTRYLVTEVEHVGVGLPAATRSSPGEWASAEPVVYRCELTAISEVRQFRAERRTVWPRIPGAEQRDYRRRERERVRPASTKGARHLVRFFFDENQTGAGKASTRVRMLQPHGGQVEGWHFPLRKGTEVYCTFLAGDPDRPVISGVAPDSLSRRGGVVDANIYDERDPRRARATGSELEDRAGQERITCRPRTANSYLPDGRAERRSLDDPLHTDANSFHDTGGDQRAVHRQRLDDERRK